MSFFDVNFHYFNVKIPKSVFLYKTRNSNDEIIILLLKNSKSRKIYLHNFRKILGLIAYKKDFLIRLTEMNSTLIEEMESIEQMRIIENGYSICSVPFESSQPSVNEPSEVQLVWDYVANDNEQKIILEKVFNFNYK